MKSGKNPNIWKILSYRASVNKRTYEVLTRNRVMEAILVASETAVTTSSSGYNNVVSSKSGGLGRFNGSFRGPTVSHSNVLFGHCLK